MIKIWVDDIRTPPSTEWIWVKSVNEAIAEIFYDGPNVEHEDEICLISLDHDAGDFAINGGDYIKVLDFVEYAINAGHSTPNFVFHIHSMNPVGVQNMRAIIKRNNWKEV